MAAELTPADSLAYGSDSPNQVVDLYKPAEDGPWPLVISIHGGAFRHGDRTGDLFAVPALLARGYAVASVGYRLSGEAIFPAGVLDVKRATAHLRVRAAELNLDPSSFAAWGRSAGGHLSALLGVTTGQATEFDRPRDDSSVQAVIDWYGSSDFLQMNAQFAAGPPTGEPVPGRPLVQDHDGPESLESLWVGGPIQELPGVAARASPITYITDQAGPLPPFFLAAGTNDRLVSHQQSLILADALRAHGTPVVLHVLRDAPHGGRRFEDELTGPAIDWLDQIRCAG